MEIKCFNCGMKAEHNHHVVPRSKGGIKTVPLCNSCHSKVHNGTMSKKYLTVLGLIKVDKYILCRIFFLFFIEEKTEQSIGDDMDRTKENIKNQIKRMQQITIEDLLDVFEPILKLETLNLYTREYVIKKLKNQFNTG